MNKLEMYKMLDDKLEKILAVLYDSCKFGYSEYNDIVELLNNIKDQLSLDLLNKEE